MTALVERPGLAVPRPGRFAAMVVVANPALRDAVAHTLRALGARHVLEVGTVTEARTRAAAGIADLVVAEAGLPDGSGIALIRELRAAGWQRGIVITASEDPYSVRAAIGAGVRCYLVSAAGGGPRPVPDRSDGVDSLSAREIQVLQLVAEGKSNAAIARTLFLTKRAVEKNINSIFAKLDLADDTDVSRRVVATLLFLSETGAAPPGGS